jgi:hypothetical protein
VVLSEAITPFVNNINSVMPISFSYVFGHHTSVANGYGITNPLINNLMYINELYDLGRNFRFPSQKVTPWV